MNTPVRVGETIEGSRTMRNRPYQVLIQVLKDANCSLKVRRAGVGHEAGELRGGVGDVDARHIRKLKKPPTMAMYASRNLDISSTSYSTEPRTG